MSKTNSQLLKESHDSLLLALASAIEAWEGIRSSDNFALICRVAKTITRLNQAEHEVMSAREMVD